MANLKENSQYLDTSGPSKFKNLTSKVNTAGPLSGSNYTSAYAPAPKVDLSTLYQNIPSFAGKNTVVPNSGNKEEPVPEGYGAFMPGQKNPQGQDMWVTPSDKTYIKNYPDSLGGGQYAIDPTQPGAIVKSSRGYDPKETILLRGGLSPYDAQIDHVIPLNIGGVDTLTNKQVLSTAEHEQKTKAQAVALTLLAQGKISTSEAKSMSLNWKNYDVSDIPMPDAFGYITNMSTEKADSLTGAGTQQAKSEYYKLLGMDKLAEKTKKQWEFDVQHPVGTYGHSFADSIKAVWKEIPDAVNKAMGNSIAGEFGKGLVEGGTAGIIHAAPEEEKKSFGQISAKVAGNVLGTFIPIGLFARGLGLTAKVLSKVPGISRAFGTSSTIVNELPWLAGAAETAKPIATIIPETARTFSIPGVSKLTSSISKLTKIGKGAKAAEGVATAGGELGLQQIPMSLNKVAASKLKYGNIARNAAFFGSYGLTTQLMREGLGVQDEADFVNHAGTFVTEAITGGIMGSANQSFKGYAKVAAPALVLSYINGESPEDAFASAVTMVGLHGMGSAKMQRMGITRDVTDWSGKKHASIIKPNTNYEETIAAEMNKVADNMSHGVLNQWAPTATKKAGAGTRQYTSPELAKIQEEALTNIENKAHEQNWLPRELDAELLKTLASVRQLEKGGMGALVREQSDIADIKSAAQKLQTTNKIRTIDGGTVPAFVHETYGGTNPANLSEVNFTEKPSGDFSSVGVFPLTGYGSTINNAKTRSNVAIFEKAIQAKEAPYGDNILLVDRGSDYVNHNKLLNTNVFTKENIASGKDVPFKNPQNTVEAFGAVRMPDGNIEFLSLGFVAREHRIEKMNKLPDLNGLITYEKSNNKDSINQSLRDNGVKAVWGRQVPLNTGLMRVAGGKDGSKQEYHLRVQLTDGRWKDAINHEKSVADLNTPIVKGPTTNTPDTGKTMPVKEATATVEAPVVAKMSQSAPADKIAAKAKEMNDKKVVLAEAKATKKEPVAETPTENTETKQDLTTEKVKANPSKFMQRRPAEEGVNEFAVSVLKDPKHAKGFTREKINKLAKDVSGDGSYQEIRAGWEPFLDRFTQKIRTLNKDESFTISDPEDLRLLKKLYTKEANIGVRKELVITPEGKGQLVDGSRENTGEVDFLTRNFNKKNGFPDGSMKIVHIGGNIENKDYSSKRKNADKFQTLIDAAKDIDGKTYLPLGTTGKGVESTIFVEKSQAMVDRVNKNLSKYTNEGETLTDDGKFIRGYMVDVLGLPKDMKDADFVKRANLLYHRYDQSYGPDKKVKLKILKAKAIGDEPALVADKSQFENPDSPETKASIKSLNEGKVQDGGGILGEEAFNDYISGINYNKKKNINSIKALISAEVNGTKVYHKAQWTKADPAIRDHYKRIHGVDIAKDDVISFDSNAKIGPKSGDYDISLHDLYAKNLSTVDSKSKGSISEDRKFLSTDKGVKEEMSMEKQTEIDTLSKFNEEIQATKNKKEFEDVFGKYADKYNISLETFLPLGKGEAFKLGAAKNQFDTEFSKLSKNLLLKNAITPTLDKGTMSVIIEPITTYVDGPDKPPRYLNNKEIMIGEEQIKKLGIKEGDEVVVHRDPSYDINNIAILKVVNGTRLGHTSLGLENASVSPFNERIKLQADQDGDKLHLVKIGSGGMPISKVNAIRERGSLATPFTEVNPSKTGYVNEKTIVEKIKDQHHGDDQTSSISKSARIADEVKDNDITIRVYKAKPGEPKSYYEILTKDGHVVDEGTTSRSQSDFDAKIKWDQKERQLVSQAQRAAVDSKKSKDIYDMTEGNNPVWITKKLWDVTEGKMDDFKARSIEGALKTIQDGYEVKNIAEQAESSKDLFTRLNKTIEYYKKLKIAGVELTPKQESLLIESNVKHFNENPNEVKVAAHNSAVKELTKEFKDKLPLPSKEVLDFRKKMFATFVKYTTSKGKSNKSGARNELIDYYLTKLENGDYTPADIDNIAYWAATHEHGNLGRNTQKTKTSYVYTYPEIISTSKDVATKYYESIEGYTPSVNESPVSKFQNITNTIKNNPK